MGLSPSVEAVMPQSESRPRSPRWIWIPIRSLIITLLVTLISFAVVLLLALVGLIVTAKIQGTAPNLPQAYHYAAFPAAIVIGGAVLVLSTLLEVRQYRQTKALARIERVSYGSDP